MDSNQRGWYPSALVPCAVLQPHELFSALEGFLLFCFCSPQESAPVGCGYYFCDQYAINHCVACGPGFPQEESSHGVRGAGSLAGNANCCWCIEESATQVRCPSP